MLLCILSTFFLFLILEKKKFKVVTHKLFAEFIGFEENFEEVYDFIINSCLNEDILSLKSYKDPIR